MRTFNRSGEVIKTASSYVPQPKKQVDWMEILDTYKDAKNEYDDRTKREALVNALNGGDENEINSAYAAIDPTGAYANRMAEKQAQQQREWQIADAEQKYNWDMARLDKQHYLAKALADYKQGQSAQADNSTIANVLLGINKLQEVADEGNVGNWTRFRKSWNMTTDKQEQDLGKISAAIAALAPASIKRLKDTGVTGINTLDEFMTYVGLPENPTSEEIQGALPIIREQLKVGNIGNNDPLGIK